MQYDHHYYHHVGYRRTYNTAAYRGTYNNQSNRHMDHVRVFGKEITNVVGDNEPTKHKRNHSFVHNHIKPSQRVLNRSQAEDRIDPVREPIKGESSCKDSTKDMQMVPEYLSENLHFMKKKELRVENYVGRHGTVTEQARGKLIDWLSDLHFKYRMFPSTIFDVVLLMDLYFSRKEVAVGELQLVGVAAFFIAAKFEETYQVPQMRQLLACCAHQYTAQQIQLKEAEILKSLDFMLILNSTYKFFEPLSRLIGLEPKNHHLAQYVLELALLDPRFLNYAPSLLASAAIYLIKKIRKSESAWNEHMTNLVQYKENELKMCAKDLCSLLENAGEMQNAKALKKKFALPQFHEVTKIKLERKK